MKYLSVCSGIEAATVAWHSLEWEPIGFSEIEPFPCAVLDYHYPHVKNYGDLTKCDNWEIKNEFDILVAGTPCQSFSVAGKRGGLDDPRGQLALKFFELARRYRPKWIVWENVPGVLSSNKGRDFGLFLSEMGKCGYGFAYRVLDAQYFGVPQRRRRVFVVGHLGDWRGAAAVLFECEGLRRDIAPSRKTGKKVARGFRAGAAGSSGEELNGKSPMSVSEKSAAAFTVAEARRIGTINLMDQIPTLTSQTKRGDTEPCILTNKIVPVRETTDCLTAAYGTKWNGNGSATNGSLFAISGDIAPTLTASNDPSRSPQSSEVTQQVNAVHNTIKIVRRLTPIECERLQGFPDDYTLIPFRKKPAQKCPDGVRYRCLGNSMAVPVMAWIGSRIASVSKVIQGNKL